MAVKRDGPHGVRRRFAAVVLAAGAGRRFGGGKLMAPWRGGVLLDGALEAAFAAPAAEIVVVQGADARIGATAESFAERLGQAERLRIVTAEDWCEGLSASLRAGLTAVADRCEAAFVYLADMPDVPRDAAAQLSRRLCGDIAAAVPVFGGELGHPALIGAELFPAIARLRGDRGARGLLEALGDRLARVPVASPGVLFDVDTPDALAG